MRLDFAPSGLPYPVPPTGRPLRLAFVGDRTAFADWALEGDAHGVTARFFDDAAQAAAWHPHVIAVFRPHELPDGALRGVRAVTLGVLADPLARRIGGGLPDRGDHVKEARATDAGAFDRFLAIDPLVVTELQDALPVWRAVPPPVADRLFAEVAGTQVAPHAVLDAASTPHRDGMASVARDAGRLEAATATDRHDVGVHLHPQALLTFEHDAARHLAAGRLLVSEPLSPSHGLEHGLDYVPIGTPDGLNHVLDRLQRFPRTWHAVRVRGRRKAEHFRASAVWPRVCADLLADVAAFGTHRAS